MIQQSLFGSPNAYGDVSAKVPCQSHSETSKEAADAIKPHANTLRAAVLEYLLKCGAAGATDEEMQKSIPMNPSTQRPRRIELVDSGQVKNSGTTRKTASGHSAVVWVATGDLRAHINDMLG